MDYKQKYLKYKLKYLNTKKILGGVRTHKNMSELSEYASMLARQIGEGKLSFEDAKRLAGAEATRQRIAKKREESNRLYEEMKANFRNSDSWGLRPELPDLPPEQRAHVDPDAVPEVIGSRAAYEQWIRPLHTREQPPAEPINAPSPPQTPSEPRNARPPRRDIMRLEPQEKCSQFSPIISDTPKTECTSGTGFSKNCSTEQSVLMSSTQPEPDAGPQEERHGEGGSGMPSLIAVIAILMSIGAWWSR